VKRRQGSNVDRGNCTTKFKNTHGTVFRGSLYYHLHPWFGMRVVIHEAVDKSDGVVFRCTLSGSTAGRWLEVPAWMFDRAACPHPPRLTASPFVSVDARALRACKIKDLLPARVLDKGIAVIVVSLFSRPMMRSSDLGFGQFSTSSSAAWDLENRIILHDLMSAFEHELHAAEVSKGCPAPFDV
jgi:hypothetical protein